MACLRLNWPKVNITPKLHILEGHVVSFVTEHETGCGFYGEQGGESLHKTINLMKGSYRSVRNKMDNLNYVMNNHLAATNPFATSRRVDKKKRNLKRKDMNTC